MKDAHSALILHLQRQMTARAWSINRLADAAGIGRGALSEVMSKKRSPTLQTLQKLANALEIDAGRLLLTDEPTTAVPKRARRDLNRLDRE